MNKRIHKDIILFGGGIAGLWLLNRLRQAGYDAALLESGTLGEGQTVASQGMIHGGVKYALGGTLNQASNTIADMPSLWKACIAGEGDIDLRGTRVLSQRYFMWPRNSLRSRLTAFLGSKALRGRVDTLAEQDYPDFFRGHIPGPLYQLGDIVLDVPSLLHTLAEAQRPHIHHIDWSRAHLQLTDAGDISALTLAGDEPLELNARHFIFTSGAGTEALLQAQGLSGPAMQRRPLHMVLVRHSNSAPLYVHCVADQFSAVPELTITTHYRENGDTVWYLGGELAETGTKLSSEEQIDKARRKLETMFPWCDFSNADWHSFFIDRAEPRQAEGGRPDNAFVQSQHNFMVGWPTKLTLAPGLTNQVLDSLAEQGILPGEGSEALPLPFPGIATPPWESAFRGAS